MKKLLNDVKSILIDEFLPAVPNLVVDIGRLNDTLIALEKAIKQLEENENVNNK